MFLDEKQDKIKLIDFGLSKSFKRDSKLKTVLGTPFYVAPEVITNTEENGGVYKEMCDTWSLGINLYKM